MAVKFDAKKDFKKITLDDMCDFIEAHFPEDKAWFKKVAFQDATGANVGKYNHLNAVRKFCEKYAPDLLPKPKEKPIPKTARFDKW